VEDGSRIASELWRALRPHQWAKNLLVFVPLALTPAQLGDVARWQVVAWAFVAWCAVASLGYLANDWLDREADRADPAQRDRPFAKGPLSARAGLVAGLALAALGFGCALLFATPAFLLCLVAYLAITLAYSLFLKRFVLVDVLVLAGLYTLRLLAGGAAIGITLTAWLLAFSLFLFLGLAFVKRYVDLRRMGEIADTGRLPAGGYRVADAPLICVFGAASTYLSVLVLCLYIHSAELTGQHERSWFLWGEVPLLLYWVSRIWLLAERGELGGDPVGFAVRDRQSLATGALMGVVLLAAMGI
jgi:4-hydroxybenzoate polyprenyltransferase